MRVHTQGRTYSIKPPLHLGGEFLLGKCWVHYSQGKNRPLVSRYQLVPFPNSSAKYACENGLRCLKVLSLSGKCKLKHSPCLQCDRQVCTMEHAQHRLRQIG